MPDLLTCQGGLQINTASVTGGAGNESLSVDLPNGPKPGTIWVVDYAGFLFQDDSTLDDFTNQASGIYMVPIGTPTPDSLDSFAGGVNIAARGLPLIPHPEVPLPSASVGRTEHSDSYRYPDPSSFQRVTH